MRSRIGPTFAMLAPMAAIDGLLGIVETKRAIGLVLTSGDVPKLLPPGPRSSLTMPPLSAMFMDHLVGELLTAEQRASLTQGGAIEGTYESAVHGPYAIRGQVTGDKLTLTLTKGAARTTSAAEPRLASPIASAPVPQASSATAAPPQRPGPTPARPLASVEHLREPAPREIAARFEHVLERARARRASDILFSAGATPIFRVDGDLFECDDVLATTTDEILAYFEPAIGAERMQHFHTTGSVDFALRHPSGVPGEWTRFRANLFRHSDGVAAALRPIHTEIPGLAELQLPTTLTQLVEPRHGLVLVTGATGSGKSTTLAALLEHINRTRAAHIVTLEDPIEYVYRRRRAVIHQREVGRHVDSFASGLRAALRENPDVLLVGEMRDTETIRMALTAAQTGHLVLSTLHSGSAVMAIDRVIDAFPEGEKSHVRQELAATLRHVIAQQLLPMTNGGRTPALEILTITHAVAAQIRDARTHMIATQLETGAEEGMIPMARALATLVRAGRVSRAAAMAAAEDRAALEKLLEDRPNSRLR
jgi:twitching motility protein PilT